MMVEPLSRKMATEGNQEMLGSALKAVQHLRASVGHVFDTLSHGMKDDQSIEGKEKVFLAKIRENLLAVNRDFGELERLSSALPSPTDRSGILALSNTGILSLDPVVEKTPLYSQLLQSYKWSNKVHEHAANIVTILNQNSLKRTFPSGGLSTKRRRPFSTSHAVSNQVVDSLIQGLDRFFPDMSISLSRPLGNSAVLQIILGKTLKAIIVLRGLIIEWVNVKGFGEDLMTENGKLDIWTKSKHHVFQKVTDHTNAAMLHFYSPFIPDIAVKSFMTWLYSYTSLFTSPCHKCGKYLQDNLPPTWRDFRTLDAFHDSCRP